METKKSYLIYKLDLTCDGYSSPTLRGVLINVSEEEVKEYCNNEASKIVGIARNFCDGYSYEEIKVLN